MSNEKKKTNNLPRYQDYVISKGELVGDWEGLYQNFDDPWHQSRSDHTHDSRRMLALNWCKRLREEHKSTRVLELGCGFGYLTNLLRQNNFSAIGADISNSAIQKARKFNPSSIYVECAFSDFEKLSLFDADIYIMAEITWYILDDLDLFLKFLRKQREIRKEPVFLIHLLTTYPSGIQQYGVDKFTNIEEILEYFQLRYIESGFIKTPREDDENSQGTYFVGEI